jgi:hypothetical protein
MISSETAYKKDAFPGDLAQSQLTGKNLFLFCFRLSSGSGSFRAGTSLYIFRITGESGGSNQRLIDKR